MWVADHCVVDESVEQSLHPLYVVLFYINIFIYIYIIPAGAPYTFAELVILVRVTVCHFDQCLPFDPLKFSVFFDICPDISIEAQQSYTFFSDIFLKILPLTASTSCSRKKALVQM